MAIEDLVDENDDICHSDSSDSSFVTIPDVNPVGGYDKSQRSRTTIADIISNVSYSLSVGGVCDLMSGLRTVSAILGSRVFNLAIATSTAKYYGRWREYLYARTHTAKHHSAARKFSVEILSFNTFNIIPYGVALFSAYIVSKMKIDFDTVHSAVDYAGRGMLNTLLLSPLTATSYGWYNDLVRRWMKVETPGEKVEHCMENDEEYSGDGGMTA